MSGGVFASVVVIWAVSFVHGSYRPDGIPICYTCESDLGDYCDDPLDLTHIEYMAKSCPVAFSGGCGSARGTALKRLPNSKYPADSTLLTSFRHFVKYGGHYCKSKRMLFT